MTRFVVQKKSDEKGFTLFELLLVVSITALIFAGIAAITQSWINTEIATSSGQYMQRVATVTEKYVEANWGGTPGLPDTDDAVADLDPKWAGLRTSLNQEGLLIGGVLRNPLGSNMRISYKVDATDPTNPVYRAAVYTIDELPSSKVREASRQAGNYGGSVSVFGGNTRAVGAFGQFDVALTNLTTGTFPCTATATDSCLVAVISRNDSMLSGSYLYRDDMGDPALNTMTTDLLMNNNRVTGAAGVETQDLNVSNLANLGTTNVSGTSTFNGPTTIGAGLTANGGMDVTGNANFSDNVTMTNGTLNVDTLNSSTIQSPDVRTNTFNAQNLAVNGGNVTVDDDINVNGNITANGEVFANTVNAGTINANGGDLTVGTIDVRNTMQINGAVNVTSGNIAVDRMVADQCAKVKVPVDVDHPNGWAYYGAAGACPP